jgi:hypothetical protein
MRKKFLVGDPKRKKFLGIPGSRWEVFVKVTLSKVTLESWN